MVEKCYFLNSNWLLGKPESVKLYHEVAVPARNKIGIIDTHTHHNLRQIVENKPFVNIWRAEVLETKEEYANCDHYIIQLAAKFSGFSHTFAHNPSISDYDKWIALCKVFPYLEGNHVHQWMHLDLKRMFDIDELLSSDTANNIWEKTCDCLEKKEMLPQSILNSIRAKIICTTDDPLDDLSYHKKAKNIKNIIFLPTFRPDRYSNIFEDRWKLNVVKICDLTGQETSMKGLVNALRIRHAYFAKIGARASDHGLLEPYGLAVSLKRAEKIFYEAFVRGVKYDIKSNESRDFTSYLMHQFCEMNQEAGMVTQIHYGAVRNANQFIYKNWGADAGGDISSENINIIENLVPLLSKFFSGENDKQGHLILYPMNQIFAHTNLMLERAFPNVHSGFPWWHNDSPYIMEHYLLHSAGSSLLASSGGPVCDGRKILSEGSRFEVFDRIICRAVGKMVSSGQMSYNGGMKAVKGLMYENQINLFNLSGEISRVESIIEK